MSQCKSVLHTWGHGMCSQGSFPSCCKLGTVGAAAHFLCVVPPGFLILSWVAGSGIAGVCCGSGSVTSCSVPLAGRPAGLPPAFWSWAGLRGRPDLCGGGTPGRRGAGRRGLTCLGGIGAAALYSRRGPCSGLGAERREPRSCWFLLRAGGERSAPHSE